MNWREDSTATNISLLSGWAYGVVRPIGRILHSAGIAEAAALGSIRKAYEACDHERPKGHAGSGSRYQSVLALSSITGAWARSPEWTDENGLARELSLSRDEPSGFVALVRSIDPHLHAPAALKALEHMNAVHLTQGGQSVRLLRHTVVHSLDDTFSVEPVLLDLQRFAETIEHNLFRNRKTDDARTQLTAIRLSLDPSHFADFARCAKRLGQAFLDSADDCLTSYPVNPDGAAFGAGVFVFFEPSSGRPLGDDDSTATNVSLLTQWTYSMLRPVVRILRSAGVSHGSIQQAVQNAYQQCGGETPKGRLSSGSSERAVHALAPIPDAWAHSSDWTDPSGTPRELTLNKDDPQGFFALVRSVSPLLDPVAVLKELLHLRIAHPVGNTGRVRLLRSTLLHVGDDSFIVETVFRELQRFAETVEHNIFRNRRIEDGRFQTTAACLRLDPHCFDAFSRFVKRNGQMFLESADDRLKTYPEIRGGAGYGVGLFVFDEAPREAAS